MHEQLKISVIGMGYVGLPVALAFAKSYLVTGYDIDKEHIDILNSGKDPNQEMEPKDFANLNITFSNNKKDLADSDVYIIAVPTPVDKNKVPDLSHLKQASRTTAEYLKKGNCVIFESTVYPGCTEEICQPVLEEVSGLVAGEDFKLGYSPERINPGDKVRTFEKITKIVSGLDEDSLQFVSKLYNSVVEAGTFEARSIKVAEACKITENTQRDVNIALMNEFAIIFDRMGISTTDVIEATKTKWNFLDFYPGLVGGHCIDIDPYYLSYRAQQLGYTPEVILSGRRVNSAVPKFIAKKIVQSLLGLGKVLKECRVLIKGITFKENVSDCRNSRVFDLIHELSLYHIHHDVEDYMVNPQDIPDSSVNLVEQPTGKYDVIVLAVSHSHYMNESIKDWLPYLNEDPVIFDVKSSHTDLRKRQGIVYHAL